MTPEEKEKVLDAVALADGGCSTCVSELLHALRSFLPGEDFPAYGDDRSVWDDRRTRAQRALWAAESEGSDGT